MRTVFFGTPEWAVPSLEALIGAGIEVAMVVTNPDRPAGRGMQLQVPPVKRAALDQGLDILQPADARDVFLHERLRALSSDVGVVVAYGRILPASLLEIPAEGFVNVHFSLLPRYRGAAPVQRALMEGCTQTGVSIMVLSEGMDEGPVLAVRATPIDEEDTAGSVGRRLAAIGAELLVETLPPFVEGRLDPRPQDDAAATYAPKVTSAEARIDWSKPARSIRDLVRGLDPVPGAWSLFDSLRLKVWKVSPVPELSLPPGRIQAAGGLWVGTGTCAVELIEAQLQGKKRMSGVELARGLRLGPEAQLR